MARTGFALRLWIFRDRFFTETEGLWTLQYKKQAKSASTSKYLEI